jgi:hypothetical protein
VTSVALSLAPALKLIDSGVLIVSREFEKYKYDHGVFINFLKVSDVVDDCNFGKI